MRFVRLSAKLVENDLDTALEAINKGAYDYLLKPVNPNLLKVRVRNLLERKYAERKLRLAAHVFRHSSESIMINDKENCILDVNVAFTVLTGYGLESITTGGGVTLASQVTRDRIAFTPLPRAGTAAELGRREVRHEEDVLPEELLRLVVRDEARDNLPRAELGTEAHLLDIQLVGLGLIEVLRKGSGSQTAVGHKRVSLTQDGIGNLTRSEYFRV